MNSRQYIAWMSLGSVGALCSFLTVIFAMNPVDSGLAGIFLFYLTFFSTSLGIFVTLATIFRSARKTDERQHLHVARAIARSFRQGVFFAILLTTSLMCVASGLFSTSLFAGLLIVILLIEWWFLRREARVGG